MAELAGLGTTLQLKIASTFTTVPQCSQIAHNGIEIGEREVTNLLSTMRKRRGTILDPGEISFTMFFDPADTVHLAIITNMLAKTIAEWKLIFVDGLGTPAHILFNGFVREFPLSGFEIDGSVEAEVMIRITDTFTRVAGVA